MKTAGFTLLEVLVALLLSSLFALAAYRGLGAVLDGEARLGEDLARWRGQARAMAQLETDLGAALGPAAGVPGLLVRRDGNDWEIQLERLHAYGEGSQRRWLVYRYARGRLERQMGGVAVPILSGLATLEVRFLDDGGVWRADWPAGPLPRALEWRWRLAGGPALRRVLRLP